MTFLIAIILPFVILACSYSIYKHYKEMLFRIEQNKRFKQAIHDLTKNVDACMIEVNKLNRKKGE